MGKKVRDMNHHRPLTKILDVLSVCLPLVLHVSFLVILCVPAVFGAVYTFWAIAPLGWNQVLGCFCLFFFSAKRNVDFDMDQTGSRWTPLESTGPPETAGRDRSPDHRTSLDCCRQGGIPTLRKSRKSGFDQRSILIWFWVLP